MAGNEVIGIDIIAKLDQFRSEMAKIPGITAENAKAMASELNKSIKAVETQARAAAKGTKEATAAGSETAKVAARSKAGLVNLGNQLSDVASQLSTGTSPFTIMVQQGPQVAGALDLMGVSLKSVAIASGAVVVGAAALYGAYSILTRETEREAAAMAQAHDIARSFIPVQRELKAQTIALKVATGEYTKAQGDEATAQEAARQKMLDYADSHITLKKELRESIESAEKWIRVQRLVADVAGGLAALTVKILRPTEDLNKLHKEFVGNVDSMIDGVTGLESGSEALQGRMDALAAAELKEHDAIKQLREVTVATTDAKDKDAKATDEQAAAERRLEAAILAQGAAANRAKDILKQSGEFRLSEEEKVRAAAEESAQAYFDAGIEAKFTMERIAAGEVQLAQDTTDKIQKIRDDAAKAAAEAAAAEQARTEALARSRVQSVLKGMSDLFTQAAATMDAAYNHANANVTALADQLAAGDAYYTEAQKRELEKRLEASKRAARRAFEIEKAAKLAAAVINTASAVASALANPPGPPYSIPQAVAAGAAGAVQVATISGEQPAFHSGYAPDEMAGPPSKMLKREGAGILTPQGITALGGPAAVRNANAGSATQPSGQIVAVTVYKNDRQMQRVKYDAIRAGDPYTELMARTRPWRRA